MNKQMCLSAAALLTFACAASAQQAPRVPAPPVTAAPAPSAPPAHAVEFPKGLNTNPDAKLVADFTARVEAYNKLRRDSEKNAQPLKRTNDAADIGAAEKAMAQQIRVARANAKPGDIFTPATQAMFRRLLNPSMKGAEGAENKNAIKEDSPAAGEVPFKINGEYPKDAPAAMVPPDVLKALPPLPENLQYRFVGKHLLLYCSRGNLIVDYMLNAIS
jgi:hypothetical protein